MLFLSCIAYAIFKNSACRKLRLAEIGRAMEEKTVQPRGVFEIKYLTSEASATDATLTYYLQILKLTQELKQDKSVKRDTRKSMKKTNGKLKYSFFLDLFSIDISLSKKKFRSLYFKNIYSILSIHIKY